MDISLSDRIFAESPEVQTPGPFTVTPLTALVDTETRFQLRIAPGYRPLPRWGITELRMISHDGVMADSTPVLWEYFEQKEFSFEGDSLIFSAKLHQEGKYIIQILCGSRLTLEFAVYALEKDLYSCAAFKGDFHSHSSVSDGRQAPGLAAIRGRKRGLDFFAITDHGIYDGSVEAIEAMKDKGSSLLLCPGEEMHLPLRPDLHKPYQDRWLQMPWVDGCLAAHLVNFGGNFSVNKYARENMETYLAEVAEREAELPGDLSPYDRFSVAASEWAFDKVREGGGLAIFPHPHWPLFGRKAISDAFSGTLFERGKFDAFEAANNRFQECNYLAQAEYARQQSQGRSHSVVGCSDLHDSDKPGECACTVLLAEEFSQQGICDAVRQKRSCSILPSSGESLPVVTGEFRIVNYVYFLLQSYFPEHDKWCALESELLERSLDLPEKTAFKAAIGETSEAIARYCRSAFPGFGGFSD